MFVEQEYFVGLEDTGPGDRIENRAFLEMFGNTAYLHRALIGQGSAEGDPYAWVVINWRLEVLRRVSSCAAVRVRTWSQRWDRITAHRDFLAFDDKGEAIARATSAWMVIDKRRRFPARLTEEIMAPYGSEPESVNFPGNEYVRPDLLEVPAALSVPFTVPRCMIDLNGHVHNPAYLDMAAEALPEDAPRDRLEVCYRREVKAGMTVRVEYAPRDGKHDVFIRGGDGTLYAWMEAQAL